MSENLTHWKKNNDSRYISGEDLKAGLHGLSSEMVVTLSKFTDAETFDQSSQSKVVKTGLFFTDINGRPLYKPLIMNNTNANFIKKECNSDYMEHWIGKTFVLYALADKRHGFVARLKKYYAPAQIDDKKALADLNNCKTLADLQTVFLALTPAEQKLPTIYALKEKLKTTLK